MLLILIGLILLIIGAVIAVAVHRTLGLATAAAGLILVLIDVLTNINAMD